MNADVGVANDTLCLELMEKSLPVWLALPSVTLMAADASRLHLPAARFSAVGVCAGANN